MPTSNFRSLIRTLLRAEAKNYSAKTGINYPQITQAVVDHLADRELSQDERNDCLYSIVYSEAKHLFKKDSPQPLQLSFLLRLHVPKAHAELLVRINDEALLVPSADGKNFAKPLFGKERMTHAELGSAKALVRRKGEETIAKADLLDRLWELPGYYSRQ